MMQIFKSCILTVFFAVFALVSVSSLPTFALAQDEDDIITASANLPVPDAKPDFEVKSYKGDKRAIPQYESRKVSHLNTSGKH